MKTQTQTAAHTPGPWHSTFLGSDLNQPVICAEDKLPVAMCATCRSESAQDANARLIAAAPDLLAACEEIANYAKAHHMTGDGDWGHHEMASIARTAIAKAKGQ